MALEVIGSVGRSAKVRWERRTGVVQIKLASLFTSTRYTLPVPAFTMRAAFEVAESYVQRQ
ncbi:hypothetical protein [Phenylobacterium sp.]|uniref:hypothetical protein n=1 Tax=Phenylobacterium sp. TaxID=1871053 RepID=UPI003983C061